MFSLAGGLLIVHLPDFASMGIFEHPNLCLVRSVDFSNLVLKAFDSVVTFNIVMALVLFNLHNLHLNLLVMSLIHFVHLILMVLLSLSLKTIQLLNLIV